jgi:hypothetical protein
MFRAVTNAASTDYRYCPLWFCKKQVSLKDFSSHLLSHTSEELVIAAPELVEEGYMVIRSDC